MLGPLETRHESAGQSWTHVTTDVIKNIYIFENFEVVVILRLTWHIWKTKWSIIEDINNLLNIITTSLDEWESEKELLTHQQKRYHIIFNMQHCNKSLAWKHDCAKAFWVRVQQSIGLKGYANQYKVVLGTSAIILMSSWEIGTSLGGLSVSLFSFLTPVTRSLFQWKDF